MRKIYIFLLLIVIQFSLVRCDGGQKLQDSVDSEQSKIGVLLVNHGSRSATWRQSLLSLEDSVKQLVMSDPRLQGIKTAHMEYTEPSIATQLKAFDTEGFTDIIIVPVFLTVSSHTFDDIPTIIGQKEDPQSREMMKIENIESYKPKARTHLAPNLDFTSLLKMNVLHRVRQLSKSSADEGLVLIGYGDEAYEQEWINLFNEVAKFVKDSTGIGVHSHGWCGHVAHYDPQRTTDAINEVLVAKSAAVVIPVLVAHDENFQVKIIGGGIEGVSDYHTKVMYKPDAILPDKNVERWIVNITKEFVDKIEGLKNR